MNKFLISAVALSALALSSTAFADNTATGQASATVVTPIAVTLGTTLSFGSFTSTATAGTVDTAADTFTGVIEVLGAPELTTGTFNVAGDVTRAYNVVLDNAGLISLSNGSETMSALLSFSGVDALDAITGLDTFEVNGVLSVDANQASGGYVATYGVTVAYN